MTEFEILQRVLYQDHQTVIPGVCFKLDTTYERCPACGFEIDRDANAAINMLSRDFEKLGMGQSEGVSPVETALALFTSSGTCGVVDGKRVVETEQNREPQPHPHRSRASG